MGNGKKVIKAGVGYIISNYLLKGLSFFTIPIFARLMSTADYGIFNTYAAYDSVLCIIVGMTLHSCFKNAKYKYNDKFEEFISTCILMALVSLGTWMILINTIYPLMSDILKMSRFVVNILLLNCIGNAFILTPCVFKVHLTPVPLRMAEGAVQSHEGQEQYCFFHHCLHAIVFSC